MRFVNVKKENGTVEKFEAEKLKKSIIMAFDKAEYKNYEEHVTAVYNGVIRQLEEFPGVFRPTSSQLGSIIEDTLVYLNHTQPAKVYMLYRDHKHTIREGSKAFIDSVDNYLSQSDWRVKENSNINYSIGGLVLHSAGALAANYWLNEVYTKEIRNAHVNGDIHLHDLSLLASYCNGNDLLQLIKEGLGGVAKQVTSKPPKHLRTLIDQMVNHLGVVQNEFSGAQAYSSFDTFISPYIKHENLSYKQVKQNIQHFVFGINVPSRWGSQPPFVNITLDWVVPERYKDVKVSIGNETPDFTYGDCQHEMDMINKAFLEVMEEGDAVGKGFAYPIPTYNITKDFDWGNSNTEMLFKLTSKYGTPYFSNFINSDMDVSDSFSMCCFRGTTKGIFRIDGKIMDIALQTLSGLSYTILEGYLEGEWQTVKPIVVEYIDNFIMVSLENGKYYVMTKDHLNPTPRGLKRTDELTTADELIYNSRVGDSSLSIKISSIEEVENLDGVAYCVEVIKGDPYFQLADGLVTHNCRLRLDKSELRRRGGGLFGADSRTGSIGVVTINLPRLAYKSMLQGGDVKQNFIDGLTHLMGLATLSLELKRSTITKFMDDGLYPYTARYLGNWNNHFSTIGVLGGNEACLNLFGKDITDIASQKFIVYMLNHMRDKLVEYQTTSGNLYNLEATPAEGTSYRLAKIDQKEYGDKIITAGTKLAPYYTNSTQLPVGHTQDVFEVLDIQDQFQTKYSGGTVIHTFLGEAISDWKVTMKFVKTAFENYRLPYLSITPTYSVCPVHGYLLGEQFECKKCAEEIVALDFEINKLEGEQNDSK